MDYIRLTKIDKTITEIDEEIYLLNGATSSIICGEIGGSWGWRQKDVSFSIVKKYLIQELEEEKVKLKKEKYKLLNKKWWQFWID